MDSNESEIIFLEELNCKQGEVNGDIPKKEIVASSNGDDINEDVPDFDDLEVLDCWEEVEECNEETERNEPIEETVAEHISSPTKTLIKRGEDSTTTKRKNSEDPSKTKGKGCEESSKTKSRDNEEPKKTSKADKIITVGNSTTLDKPKASCNNILKAKKDGHDQVSNRKDNETSNNTLHKESSNISNRTKCSDTVGVMKNDEKASKRTSSPILTGNAQQSVTAENEKSSRRLHESSKDRQTSQKKSNEKDVCRSILNLPKDATETKVDRFLKEMARQNPHINRLNTTSHDEKSLDAISSDSSKHSSILSPSGLDYSDYPPGVDMDQVAQDSSASILVGATRQSQTQPSRGNQESSRQMPREHLDTSKVNNREKEGRSRSPYSKNQEGNSLRNSGTAPRRESSHESFSLSPSPTPRSRRLSPSSAQYSRVPPNFNYTVPNTTTGYTERPLYPNPSLERNRFHRSPARDTSLRELSRSLSRERLRHRSRSRSRGRTFSRRRSRSRHRYSSKEDHYRRYRRSSSHNRSPTRRGRSRSRSPSRHQYSSKRSPLWDDDQRSKRPRLSRSISRSRSPWKSHAETSLNEWHVNYSDGNRNAPRDEEVKLEHDMARFIATNIAVTNLRPPVNNATAWYETGTKPQDVIPSNSQAIPEPPDIGDHGMPLPPPPPDISELMTPEEIKETRSQQEMSPVPPVSLSSLLESAVTGFPEKVIIDRCQDAIMKLHDVSIKPGRFAVISTIKVPQEKPSTTFQPWQSVLNRSLASKIHLSFSKLCEQPVFWKPKPVPIKPTSGSSSHSLIIPVSSTADMDRSALLERIFLLTRELQEVRRMLDHRHPSKQHKAVQTSFVNYCDNCGNGSSWQPVRQPVPQSVGQPQPVSQPQSSRQPQPVSQSVIPQPVPGAQLLRQPHPASVPLALRPPPPAQPPQSTRLPQPVAPPPPAQVLPPKPVPAPSLTQNPHQTSLLGPPPIPIAGPSQTMNWRVTNQPGPSAVVGSASSFQSHVPSTSSGEQQQVVSQAKLSTIPSLMSIVPGAEKTAKKKIAPVQKGAALSTALNSVMASTDYDVTKYQMVGDEHLYDLILYFRNFGKNINIDSTFVSTGLNIDKLLKNVIGAGETLQRQVILYCGMYDENYSVKTLCKFKQLIGYLKRRCSHLVVIEPPPIPKHAASCKIAWNSFTSLEKDFLHFKSANVSIVKIMPLFLMNPGVPKNELFSDSHRVNMSGLKIIAQELEKVIATARKAKYWLS